MMNRKITIAFPLLLLAGATSLVVGCGRDGIRVGKSALGAPTQDERDRTDSTLSSSATDPNRGGLRAAIPKLGASTVADVQLSFWGKPAEDVVKLVGEGPHGQIDCRKTNDAEKAVCRFGVDLRGQVIPIPTGLQAGPDSKRGYSLATADGDHILVTLHSVGEYDSDDHESDRMGALEYLLRFLRFGLRPKMEAKDVIYSERGQWSIYQLSDGGAPLLTCARKHRREDPTAVDIVTRCQFRIGKDGRFRGVGLTGVTL